MMPRKRRLMTVVVEREVQWPEAAPAPAQASNHAARRRFGYAPTVGMLLPVRVFIAAGWLRAGAEKLIDPAWWHGTVLRGFLAKQHGAAIPFFRPVMDHLIAPAAIVVALTVMVTQLMCGVMIATGHRMQVALRWAFFMNVTFILAGRVTPSAFYLVLELVLLFAIADGALSTSPSTPSRRTFTAAALAAVAAATFIPYIRTIEPAKVIEDPAMMLMFTGFLLAFTLVVRLASHPVYSETRLGRLWSCRLAGWVHAKPRTLAPPGASSVIGEVPPWPDPAASNRRMTTSRS
jgi:hypothetical protein